MKCPHCGVYFHDQPEQTPLTEDDGRVWAVAKMRCSSCKGVVLYLCNGPGGWQHGILSMEEISDMRLIHPKVSARLVPAEVPGDIAEDYREAALVLSDSPKASAALSRRCLQAVIREATGIRERTLAAEIDKVLKTHAVPSFLGEQLDAVREIGNFAAHPQKSEDTGTIMDVEPAEATWNLDVLDGLFDFFYVQPALAKRRKDQLNEKLGKAGKQPLP